MCFRPQAAKVSAGVIKAYYIIKNLAMYDPLPAVFLNCL